MPGKEGGKAKPLKKAKSKQADLDDDDLAFKQKQKEDAAKLKALKEQAAGKGAPTPPSMTTLSRDTRRFNIWTRLNPADLVDRTRAPPPPPAQVSVPAMKKSGKK